jgi:NAD dependent epimerase/dehydratase family enzyme
MNDHIKRIVLAGGSGFLGHALAAHFLNLGWDVVTLTRSPQPTGGIGRQVAWDGRNIDSWQTELQGATAVVNLTGKSVDCRYTARNRKEILSSVCSPCSPDAATWS